MAAQLSLGPRSAATSRETSETAPMDPSLPTLRIRGRSVMALVIAPEPPFTSWFAALDQQMRRSAGFFADRPVVADLSAVFESAGRDAIAVALDGLEERGLRVIGAEGVEPSVLAGTSWARLPTSLQGRDVAKAAPRDDPPAAVAAPSLLVDRPVRSGESLVYENGDIIVVGTVASGAEVVAGGSIHIYGTLRGRALAGLRAGASARIFCRRLEAELVGVDHLYRTADQWGPDLHGCAVQVHCDRGALRLSALD
jgi:septum site-determining protein MinC